jgi:hypothetical protein
VKSGATAQPRYLLLRRALRNAGDFLIFERAKFLIESVRPDASIDAADAWRPLSEQIASEELGRYRAMIIAGGPGYATGLVRTYPLGPLDQLPPLVLLALGSFVVPGTPEQLGGFRFDNADREFLDQILTRSSMLGARDPVTARLLRANGYDRVLMTGDPAWYDLGRLFLDPIVPSRIGNVAFTPPANPAYFQQAVDLFERFASDRPDCSFTIVHHRGVQVPFERLAQRHGWLTREISGSAEGFAAYDEVDLHLGYRVHAHLYATSRGVLSYLIAEDSRGVGAIEGLGGLGIPGFGSGWGGVHRLAMAKLPRYANPVRPGLWRLALPTSRILRAPDVSRAMVGQIRADEIEGFPAHYQARNNIRATLSDMQRMIATLP